MGKRRTRISVSPSVLILLCIAVLTDRTGIVFLTVLAALLHECGHLAAAKLLGIRTERMQLGFLGMRLETGGTVLSYGAEWLLCAAGPLTSLLCAALAAPLWQTFAAARIFSCASLVLGFLNLLPIRTFDGGRMLESFLNFVCGTRISGRVMTLCSFLFLFLLWATAVYFLLRVGDGLSLFCFSMSLFLRFFDGERF